MYEEQKHLYEILIFTSYAENIIIDSFNLRSIKINKKTQHFYQGSKNSIGRDFLAILGATLKKI